MVGPLKNPKPAFEVKRERDVFKLYAAFQNIPHVENLGPSPDTHAIPSEHVPRSSSDASLVAFCQLAAMRLNAARSLISLIDGEYQYILAEATPKTSLRAGSSLNKRNDLGFGSIRLPRRWGICEKVLDPTALAERHDGIIIINDFTKSEQHAKRSYVRDGPLRFYAGVPLVTKSGSIVGAVCILDNLVRDGLSEDDIVYLQDLAVVVMEYLVTYTVKDRYRRAAEGMQGLMTFAEGDAASRAFSLSEQKTPFDNLDLGQVLETPKQQDGCTKDPQTGAVMLEENVPQQYDRAASPSHESSNRRQSVSELQESLLSGTTKELFARAAEIMRRSNDMSGVMFMDASYAATGPQDPLPKNAGKHCQILGFSTHDQSSSRGDVLPIDMVPCEANFKQVLSQYPQGYSLSCDGAEESSHSEDNAPNESFSYFADIVPKEQRLQVVNKDREAHNARIKALIPNIKSCLFLPLWDFERGRWFAGCFCWSTRAERVLDGRLDLPFLKAFGHSIMQEVARLDALATSQSKTTFLSSLSHELRTPLHGILGSAHLMRNSRLDTFQVSMLNAVNVCGRTLLETVEHLLDHAERPERSRNYASITSCTETSICIASEKLNATTSSVVDSSAISKCNLGFITEEVVETMIIGEAPFNITADTNEDGSCIMDDAARQEIAKKRSRFIILDISDHEALGFHLSASSYGRIVMNLFGNALKFTETGYVHISLRSENLPNETGRGTVVLQISDSGIGMTPSFLQRAFEPFRKQNQHTTGTGVGLAVVKRIIEDVGGQIEIHSKPSKGTDVVLRLPLNRLSDKEASDPKINPLPLAMAGLKGRKVCLFYQGSEPNDSAEQVLHKETLKRYVEVLAATLSKVLQLDIYHTSVWDGSDESEVVICPEVSFDSLETIRRNAAKAGRRCPATVLIAMDILEAETLRSDARVTSRESIVQPVTQPCGPYKLSIVLNACLHQYDNPQMPASTSPAADQGSPTTRKHRFSQFGPKLGLYPPALAIRTKSSSSIEQVAVPVIQAQSPPQPVQIPIDGSVHSQIEQALIVDDNNINRRLLSTWMKRRKIPFEEAKDGQQALDSYKDAPNKFDLILMDISMPVMDGMTATRLIRNYEKEKELPPSHIIALTGLTSASARLEAWTSGVDDFLTKPVDFKKLESLMAAGRGGEGTGFTKESTPAAPA